MKKVIIAILIATLFSDCFSQYFPFDSIPETLKKGGCAVIRSEQCLFTILKPGVATMKIKTAVTLLNEESSVLRYVTVGYDKFSKVNYLRGMIYDEKGKTIKSLGTLDVFDINAIPGGTFYSDYRMKVLYFPVYRYPYTIEYEYEVSYSSLIDYPQWEFQPFRNVSVEKSGIQFVVPEGMKLRYYGQHLSNNVDSIKIGSFTAYTWMETNLPAKPLLKSRSIKEYIRPVLFTSPLDFEYGGFKGSLRSWESLGKWTYELNKDRDLLPTEEEQTVRNFASRIKDEKELIKTIYEYVQSRTRYLSVQIGIGGYRTAQATDVSKNGFGDCKALVNYTMALLKVAGIKSYYTLVKAGADENDINTDFVYNYFNHVILCVPRQNDTIWLECTDQTIPFNYLGTFTSDRHVLVITPDGGKLARIPAFRKEQNLVSNTGNFFLSATGPSSAILKTSSSGYFFDDMSSMFSLQSEEGIKRTMSAMLEYPDFSLTSAKYSESRSENPLSSVEFRIEFNELAMRQGNKLYLVPSFSKESFISTDTSVLKVPVSGSSIDSITYYLPVGYKVESIPGEVLVKSGFGTYSFNITPLKDRFILYRRFELYKGRITPDKYGEFRKFYNSIARSDRSVVILSKAGQP
jgi:transglutaminase-like putative cysteine protease